MPSLPVSHALHACVAPYRRHAVSVSQGHVLNVEDRGNPAGIAAVVLHGGPGSGCSPLLSRFFDPSRYRVIAIDQRGAGLSSPRGSVLHNTTGHLIDDLCAVRELLGVTRWLVVGGSWGATLAVAYAAAHPAAVSGLLLRAVFLARRQDIDGFFQHAGGEHTAAWSRFASVAPANRRHDMLRFLTDALAQENAVAAALAWWRWECALAGTETDAPEPCGDALAALIARYRIQSHYLSHRCWLEAPPLLTRASQLADVPTLLLHGRDDLVCPPAAALELHRCIPHSRLQWVDGAGHDPSHPAMASAMVNALNAYASP